MVCCMSLCVHRHGNGSIRSNFLTCYYSQPALSRRFFYDQWLSVVSLSLWWIYCLFCRMYVTGYYLSVVRVMLHLWILLFLLVLFFVIDDVICLTQDLDRYKSLLLSNLLNVLLFKIRSSQKSVLGSKPINCLTWLFIIQSSGRFVCV